jgi:hypothetical protein
MSVLRRSKLAILLSLALPASAWAQAEPQPQPGTGVVDNGTASTQPQPQLVPAEADSRAEHSGRIVVPKNTMVRLMVLSEVNTRQKKPGDRFVLRVDEPVVVDGVTIVPVGARAWGEVTGVKENGAAGTAGKISARLLHIDVGAGKIPLNGEEQSKGPGSGNRVAMAVIGFGVLGLLMKGNDGKLKGGHIFNGYIANEMLYDPGNAGIEPAAGAEELSRP